MLDAIDFAYLPILHDWGWMDFVHIKSPLFFNLVRAFFSNAKLEHDESEETVIAITSFFMGTPFHLTVKDFGNLLPLPSGGLANEKATYDPTLYIHFVSIS